MPKSPRKRKPAKAASGRLAPGLPQTTDADYSFIQIVITGQDYDTVTSLLENFYGGSASHMWPLFLMWEDGYRTVVQPDGQTTQRRISHSFRLYRWNDGSPAAELAWLHITENRAYILAMFGGRPESPDWQAVRRFTREVLVQMERLGFEILLVKPEDLTPDTARAPWDQLRPEDAQYRDWLRLWCEGWSREEIVQRLKAQNIKDVATATVTNVISRLRVKYGKDIVPLDKDRRKSREYKNG